MMALSRLAVSASSLWLVALLLCGCSNAAVMFSKDEYDFRVKEGVQVGTAIGTVQASAQGTQAAGVLYRILSTVPEESLISVSSTGELVTATTIDRESIPGGVQLSVVAYAVNGRGEAIGNSTATVRIEIEDVNDNKPVLLEDHFHVMPSLSPGSVLGQLVATDKDLSADVSYHILDGTGPNFVDGLFAVNSSTGVLTLSTKIPTSRAQAVINVQARNTDSPFLASAPRAYTIRIGLWRSNGVAVQENPGIVRTIVTANQGQLCFTSIGLNIICSAHQTLFGSFKLGCNSDPLSTEMKQVSIFLICNNGSAPCGTLHIPPSTSSIAISMDDNNRTMYLTGFYKISEYIALMTTIEHRFDGALGQTVSVTIQAKNACGQITLAKAQSDPSQSVPVQVAVNGATGKVPVSTMETDSAEPFNFGKDLAITGGSCQTLVKSMNVSLSNAGPGETLSANISAAVAQSLGLTLHLDADMKQVWIKTTVGLPLANFSSVLQSLQYSYTRRPNSGIRPPRSVHITGMLMSSGSQFKSTEIVISVIGSCQPEVSNVALNQQPTTVFWSQYAQANVSPKSAGVFPWVGSSSSSTSSSGSCQCHSTPYRQWRYCVGRKIIVDALRHVQHPAIVHTNNGAVLDMNFTHAQINVSSSELTGKSNRHFFISTKFFLAPGNRGGSIVEVKDNTYGSIVSVSINSSGLLISHSSVSQFVHAAPAVSAWHQLVVTFDYVTPQAQVYLNGQEQAFPSFYDWYERQITFSYQIIIGGRHFGSTSSGYEGKLTGLLLGPVGLDSSHVACLQGLVCLPCLFDVSQLSLTSSAAINGYGSGLLHTVKVQLQGAPKDILRFNSTTLCRCHMSLWRRQSTCTGDQDAIDMLDNYSPKLSDSTVSMAEPDRKLTFDGNHFFAIGRGLVDIGGKDIENLTISAWYRQDSGNKGFLFAIHSLNKRRLAVYLHSATKYIQLYFYLGDNKDSDYYKYRFSCDQLGDSIWHHLAIIKSSSSVTAFVDGKELTITGQPGSAVNRPTTNIPQNYLWFVGARPDLISRGPKSYFKGSIAGMTLSTKATTKDEVNCLAGLAPYDKCPQCLFATPPTGITPSYTSNNLTLSGDRYTSVSAMQKALRTVRFQSDWIEKGHLHLGYTFGNVQSNCENRLQQNITIDV